MFDCILILIFAILLLSLLFCLLLGKTRTQIALILKQHEFRDMLVQSLYALPIDQQHQLTVKSEKFFKQCQVPTPLANTIAKTFDQRKNKKTINIDNNIQSSSQQISTIYNNHQQQQKQQSNRLFNIEFYNAWKLKSYEMINCTEISPIIETISVDFKCFTLFYNETVNNVNNNIDAISDKYSNKIPTDVVSNLKYLAWIQLNRDFILNGLLYIHQPER